MKFINAALQEKNLKLKELSDELKDRIAQHKEMIVKYNMACEEYENDDEEDAETEAQLDRQEDFIAQNEQEIADEIRAIEKPSDEPAPNGYNPPPVVVTKNTEPKKGNSAGWLIFGGAVLLVTLGAVNVFKKK